MDRMLRRLSMELAKSTSRRGFLAKMARGAVGMGMGSAFLFGGRLAFADTCSLANNTCSNVTASCGESGDNGPSACDDGALPTCGASCSGTSPNFICPTVMMHGTEVCYYNCCCGTSPNGQIHECYVCNLPGGLCTCESAPQGIHC